MSNLIVKKTFYFLGVFWVMKTVIGDRCYIGPDSSLMGGAKVGNDSSLAPLSVCWKMQELEGSGANKSKKHFYYHGNPTLPID